MKKIIFYLGIIFIVIAGFIFRFNLKNNKVVDLDEDEKTITEYIIKETYGIEDEFEKALNLMKGEKYQKSINILETLLDKVEESHSLENDIIHNLAIGYYHLENYEKANEFFDRRDYSENIIIERYVADMYFNSLIRSENFNKVIEKGKEYITLFKDHELRMMIYDYMFSVYIKLEEYDSAKALNDKLKKIEPNNVYHYQGTVFLYQQMEIENKEIIIEYLKATIKKFPNNEFLKKALENYEISE